MARVNVSSFDASRRPVPSPAPIRGRSDQLADIDGSIGALHRGRGSVWVIEGPPGIGKSRLLAEVGSRASRSGAHELAGRAYEDQQTVPFGPLLSAALNASPPIGDPDVLRGLGTSEGLGFWVVHELQTALSSAAAQRPLAITIDDLHWADAGTLMALRTLTSGLCGLPVMWALATRPLEGRAAVYEAVDAVAALTALETHRVRLTALTEHAVAEMANDVLHADADDALLELTQRTHGNPFLVQELLRGLREEDRIRVDRSRATAVGHDLPHRLTENMNQRLDRLSEEARRLVHVASILPARFSATLLAKMLAQSPTRLLASVEEAIRADLLAEDDDHFLFRHDLLRQAARQSIPHSLRRAMERESAQILLEQGAGPVEVASQLARSATVGDVEAVTALREAASTLVQSDPSGAADLSLRAVALLRSDDAGRAAVIAETAERLNRASRWEEVQQLAASTVSTDMPVEAEALLRLSLSTVNEGSNGARLEQNRLALELSGVSQVSRARHLGYLAHNLVFVGETQEALEAATVAMDAAVAADDLYARLLAEITLAMVDCSLGSGRRCLDRVYGFLAEAQGADEKIAALAVCHGANLLMVLGHLDEGNALCDMAIAASQNAHYDEAVHVYTHLRAVGELAAGRLSAARTLVESVPEGQRLGMKTINGMLGSPTMAALSANVDDVPLQRLVGEAVRPGLGEGLAEQRLAVGALAHIAWQRGDLDEAARWLSAELDLLGTPPSPIHLDHLVIAARLVGSSGDAGLRQRVLATAARLESDEDPLPVFAGVAMHARALLDRDLDALTAAAHVLEGTARVLLAAGAHEDIGHLLARNDLRDGAIEHLTIAFDTYNRCESTADCHRVARTLQAMGVSRRVVRARSRSGLDSLTASERRVMELVAAGATNPEVARELSISSHTVNSHLRKVFAKLGVHTRAELVSLVRDDRPPAAANP